MRNTVSDCIRCLPITSYASGSIETKQKVRIQTDTRIHPQGFGAAR